MKLLIGIIVDLRNYKDYFSRFDKEYGCDALEFHLLESDLDAGFSRKLGKIKDFVREKNIKRISFHSPDRILQSVLFEEKSDHLEEDKKKLMMLLNALKKLSAELGQDIIMVFHQGIKLPAEMIDSMTDEELAGFRGLLLDKAKNGYDWLMDVASGSKLKPMLENSPPISAGDGSYHMIDMAFEDMASRLGHNGFVLDISHAAMCAEYFRQDKIRIPALEALRREYKGVPESLESIEAYVKKAKHNISWIHISDANGILGENEGLPIGSAGSIVGFKSLFRCIEKEINDPIGVLEIVDSHKDFSRLDKSMESLKKNLI